LKKLSRICMNQTDKQIKWKEKQDHK
jgi:hypothetical protein